MTLYKAFLVLIASIVISVGVVLSIAFLIFIYSCLSWYSVVFICSFLFCFYELWKIVGKD